MKVKCISTRNGEMSYTKDHDYDASSDDYGDIYVEEDDNGGNGSLPEPLHELGDGFYHAAYTGCVFRIVKAP